MLTESVEIASYLLLSGGKIHGMNEQLFVSASSAPLIEEGDTLAIYSATGELRSLKVVAVRTASELNLRQPSLWTAITFAIQHPLMWIRMRMHYRTVQKRLTSSPHSPARD